MRVKIAVKKKVKRPTLHTLPFWNMEIRRLTIDVGTAAKAVE